MTGVDVSRASSASINTPSYQRSRARIRRPVTAAPWASSMRSEASSACVPLLAKVRRRQTALHERVGHGVLEPENT